VAYLTKILSYHTVRCPDDRNTRTDDKFLLLRFCLKYLVKPSLAVFATFSLNSYPGFCFFLFSLPREIPKDSKAYFTGAFYLLPLYNPTPYEINFSRIGRKEKLNSLVSLQGGFS